MEEGFIIRIRIYRIGEVTVIKVQKGLFKDQRTVTKQPTPQSGSQARPAAGVRWVGRLVQKSASLWLPPLSLHGASDGGPGTAAGQQGWQ